MTNFNPEKLLQQLKQATKPDPAFASKLRAEILDRAQTKIYSSQSQPTESNIMHNKISPKSLFFVLTASFAALALFISTQGSLNLNQTKVAEREGFGQLPTLQQTTGGLGAGGDAALSARPQSGGGGGGIADTSQLYDPNYLPPKVTYSFSGELPAVPSELLVFRDNPSQVSRSLISELTSLTGLNLFRDLRNSRLESVSIFSTEKRLRVSVDQQGSFNIWSTEQFDYNPIEPTNIPADEAIIAAANSYLDGLGIDHSAYQEPFVDNSYRRYIAEAQNNSPTEKIWAPNEVTVIYSTTLENLPVVNWGGRADGGLSVMVNLNQMRGHGVSGVYETSKEQSLYPTTAAEKVINKALLGGLNPYWGGNVILADAAQEADRPQVQIALTEAKLAYLRYFNYQNEVPESYWVPVFVFIGQQTQDGQTFEYSTIVPAIDSSLFKNFEDQPPVQILPADTPASEPSAE